jgi:hypothetical protein
MHEGRSLCHFELTDRLEVPCAAAVDGERAVSCRLRGGGWMSRMSAAGDETGSRGGIIIGKMAREKDSTNCDGPVRTTARPRECKQTGVQKPLDDVKVARSRMLLA